MPVDNPPQPGNPIVVAPPGWGTNWKAKLAAARTGAGKAVIAIQGDSVGHMYASTFPNTWPRLLRSGLQTPSAANGGSGYVAVANNVTDLGFAIGSPPVVRSGAGWAASLADGPGLYSLASSAVGNTLTFTVEGTTLKIYYIKFVGNGQFTWAVDGGGATTVDTNAATGVGVVTISGQTATTHSIVCTVSTAAAVGIYGASGEYANGVVVNDYTINGNDTAKAAANGSAGNGRDWSGGASYPCDLLIHQTLVNNTQAGYTSSLDVFFDELDSIVSAARDSTTAGGSDILFYCPAIGTYQSTGRKYYALVERLLGYAASKGAAVILGDVAMRNSRQYGLNQNYYGQIASPGAAGTDPVHVSNTGMTTIANQLLAVVGTT